jgi:hypothetical protein
VAYFIETLFLVKLDIIGWFIESPHWVAQVGCILRSDALCEFVEVQLAIFLSIEDVNDSVR